MVARCGWLSHLTARAEAVLSASTAQGGRQQGRRNTVALNSVHCNPQNPSQFVVGGNGACLRVYDQRMVPAGNGELTQPVRGR